MVGSAIVRRLAKECYSIAKVAGIKLCQAYRRQYGCEIISAMPTNLYGSNDNFDRETGHVLPSLLRRIHFAKQDRLKDVELWGKGTPRREFLHVDNLAGACSHLPKTNSEEDTINVGVREDVSIAKLARIIAGTVGWDGTFHFDISRPGGTPRELLRQPHQCPGLEG